MHPAAPPRNLKQRHLFQHLYILADDLGYGELGAYDQEVIETPNQDALTTIGMRFIDHYSGAQVCTPARCVLLTGQHSGHVLLRGNDEDGSRGDVLNFQAMFDDPRLEGQRPIPDSLVTMGEVLQTASYVGKWGLGGSYSEDVSYR